jgi:hypothetical protein
VIVIIDRDSQALPLRVKQLGREEENERSPQVSQRKWQVTGGWSSTAAATPRRLLLVFLHSNPQQVLVQRRCVPARQIQIFQIFFVDETQVWDLSRVHLSGVSIATNCCTLPSPMLPLAMVTATTAMGIEISSGVHRVLVGEDGAIHLAKIQFGSGVGSNITRRGEVASGQHLHGIIPPSWGSICCLWETCPSAKSWKATIGSLPHS